MRLNDFSLRNPRSARNAFYEKGKQSGFFFRFLGERARTVSEGKLFARRCQTAPVGLISAVSTVGERAPRT